MHMAFHVFRTVFAWIVHRDGRYFADLQRAIFERTFKFDSLADMRLGFFKGVGVELQDLVVLGDKYHWRPFSYALLSTRWEGLRADPLRCLGCFGSTLGAHLIGNVTGPLSRKRHG